MSEKLLSTNPEFDTCKNRTCFIFLREEPYIILNESELKKQSSNRSFVFNCNDSGQIRGLGGTAFEVIRRTAARNSACVWGGPDCSFNNMVDFIDKTAKKKETRPYRFAGTGLLTENADRTRPHVIPSKSLFTEELVIYGVDERRETRRAFPFQSIWQPFHAFTWLSLVTFIVAVIFAAILTARAFGPCPFSCRSFATYVVHGYSDYSVAAWTPPPKTRDSSCLTPEEREREYAQRITDRLATYKLARTLIRYARHVILIVFLLFYEMAVAKFLFVEQRRPLIKDILKVKSQDGLKHYCVEKNAATEDTWYRTVVGSGHKNDSLIRWHRGQNNRECFDWVLDEKNIGWNTSKGKERPRFVVGFKSAGTYQVLRLDSCKRMKIFRTVPALYQFGAGWIFGSTVPEEERLAVDRDFGNVKLSKELNSIAKEDIGTLDSANCKTIFRDIDIQVLGIVVLIISAPFFLLLILVLVFYYLRSFPVADDVPSVFVELKRNRVKNKRTPKLLRRRRGRVDSNSTAI